SVKEEFGSLTVEQLNWKPNSKTWSIGQVLDHLNVINNTYCPIIKELKEGTYKLIWLGKVDFIVRFFGDFILKSVNPDRRRRMKTLPIWEPTKSNVDLNIVSKFVDQQSLLKENIQSCSALLDQNIVISSPANRIIVYKLDRAFDIIVTHERRHLEQARELDRMRN
ncbi:MAG: DinB family protein, partial [Bacteroidetes bacterium]|nr:DinB family protein [Bacteroidota bacterium]